MKRDEQVEQQLWIDLCGADGMRYALPYRELHSIEMPSPQKITLRFADRRVVVQGRNLEPVYEDLIRARVAQLREDDLDWASESETFISKLTIVRSHEHD
jgi:hypothetical protein